MLKKIIQKFIAKLYHYALAIDRRMYRFYVADRQVFSDMGGVNLRGKIHLYSKNISVGESVSLWPDVYFSGENITIGNNVQIGYGTIIHSSKGVIIGSNTQIAAQCYIIDTNHGTAYGELMQKQPLQAESRFCPPSIGRLPYAEQPGSEEEKSAVFRSSPDSATDVLLFLPLNIYANVHK